MLCGGAAHHNEAAAVALTRMLAALATQAGTQHALGDTATVRGVALCVAQQRQVIRARQCSCGPAGVSRPSCRSLVWALACHQHA